MNVNCFGSCGTVGLATGSNTFSGSSTLPLADWTLGTGGPFDPSLPQSLAGALGFTQPFNGNYALIGAESGVRLFALPELEVGVMLTSGIVGLALFGSRRRT